MIIKEFWKANRGDFIIASLIYFFVGMLIGAKKGVIVEGFFWLILIAGLVACFLFGFLLWLFLGGHKE